MCVSVSIALLQRSCVEEGLARQRSSSLSTWSLYLEKTLAEVSYTPYFYEGMFLPSPSPPHPFPPLSLPSLPSFPALPVALLEFILEDFRARFDIATAWLFAEYSIAEGYLHSRQIPSKYNRCLTELMLGAKASLNPRDRLFSKLVLEAPKVTPEALEIIRSYCRDEVCVGRCVSGVWGCGVVIRGMVRDVGVWSSGVCWSLCGDVVIMGVVRDVGVVILWGCGHQGCGPHDTGASIPRSHHSS